MWKTWKVLLLYLLNEYVIYIELGCFFTSKSLASVFMRDQNVYSYLENIEILV